MDDPTISGLVKTCNACAVVVALTGGGNTTPLVKWVDVIVGEYIKSIDNKHLYEDNSGLLTADKSGALLDAKTADIITSEYYPHWEAVFGALMGGDKKPLPKPSRNMLSGSPAMARFMSSTNSGGTIRIGPHRQTWKKSSPP